MIKHFLLYTAWCITGLAWGNTVVIAENGKSAQKISIGISASPQTKLNAIKLQRLLHSITGAEFQISTGDGLQGIALGKATDFPLISSGQPFDDTAPEKREEYLLKSHSNGLWLIGSTDLGAQNAMWDFLYRIGYRQYFPGEVWEIVPRHETLSIAINSFEKPSYIVRRIWYAYGMLSFERTAYEDWCQKNRCAPGFQLNSGHSYNKIVEALKTDFGTHPEYLPLIDGKRQWKKNVKPELGNPIVRQKIIDHVVQSFTNDPSLDSFSIDPSDGGDWSESPESAKLGTVTDQAVTLANEVAVGVTQRFPQKIIGMYGYYMHSPPPNIRVHPNLVISIATAFIKGGYTVDELFSGWSKMGARLGVREYYGVNAWDRDLPGKARGGDLGYLQSSIPHFYNLGARFMSAESSDNWGANGLGYWFANRMLWNIGNSQHKDEYVGEFLTNAFGDARAPMQDFYSQLDGNANNKSTEYKLAHMFHALNSAYELANSPLILQRLDQLTLYSRYVMLFLQFGKTAPIEKQSAFEDLMDYAWRIKSTLMIHYNSFYNDFALRDKSVKIPPNARWKFLEANATEPFNATELRQFRVQGAAAYPLPLPSTK